MNTDRIAVYGASKSGKSTYVKALIKSRRRVVVFDVMEEYGGTGRGFVTVRRADYAGQAAAGRAILRLMADRWRDFRIAYVPQAGMEKEELSWLSKLVCEAQRPFKGKKDGLPLTLVVEEMNTAFSDKSLPSNCMGFGEICSRGRHCWIEAVGISQRPAEVNTRFRGNATETICFRLADAADLGWIRATLGSEYVDKIRSLKPHHYVKRDEFGGLTEGKNRI